MRARGRMPIRRDGLRVLGGTLDVHGEVVSGGEAGDRIGMRRAAQLHVQRRQLLRVRRHDVVLLARVDQVEVDFYAADELASLPADRLFLTWETA
jgi:hypothetical protein